MSVAWVGAGIAALGVVGGAVAAEDAEDAQHAALQESKAQGDAAAQLGRDQLQFAKDQWNELKPARDKALTTSQQAAEAALVSQKQQDQLAAEYAAYNRETFRPLEQNIVAGAAGFDTPERRNAAAAEAVAGVDANFARVQEGMRRQLGNPGSTRAIAAMGGLGVEQAKAGAGAAYTARRGVETTGFARQMDAASLGRNLPSNQATSAGLALQAGNSATGSANSGVSTATGAQGPVLNAFNGAIGATGTAGQIYANNAAAIARNGANSSSQWGALGSVGGQMLSRFMPSMSGGIPGAGSGDPFNFYRFGTGGSGD